MDFNVLWQNFVNTVTNHYVDFNGRVGRAQFWYYLLVVIVLAIIVAMVASVTTRLLSMLFSLALLLPNLGMGIRRLHDVGKPWFYVLLPLVPSVLASLFLVMFLLPLAMLCWLATLVASVYLIYLYVQPGDPAPNMYGPPPAEWSPSAATPVS
ncbi:MAG: DUF805 domain-containing protein [Alphaproteobacteria bacterium]|nr:DUF805 domain-containing protein [Alphaproteobacteria bacterium]